MGTFTMERVLGDHTVFGYRTAFVDKSADAVAGFKNMLQCVSATKQDPSADPLVKFWQEVSELHSKAAVEGIKRGMARSSTWVVGMSAHEEVL